MNLEQLGKALIFIAVIVAFSGILIYLIGKGLGLGRLPGDILISRGNRKFFFPIVTSILVSVILTIIINVVLWLLRR